MRPRALLVPVRIMLERFDFICSGAWWWRWQRQRAEAALDRTLRLHGELSFESARATNRVAQMDFATEYWRDAPDAVRRVVNTASTCGVPVEALRLAVMSRDVMLKGNAVNVRRSRVLHLLANCVGCLVGVHWILMMALTFAQSGPAALKVAVAIAVTMTYLLLHRGWSLFLGRPCKAMMLWGDKLQRIADAQRPAPVVRGAFDRR